MEALYPAVGVLGELDHLSEEFKFVNHVREHGIWEPYVPTPVRRMIEIARYGGAGIVRSTMYLPLVGIMKLECC